MLRTEAPWFAMFIKICDYYFQFTDEYDDMDYDAMKRVLECDSYRKVWSIVTAYKEKDFRERIQTYQELAQRVVARERKYELTAIMDYH